MPAILITIACGLLLFTPMVPAAPQSGPSALDLDDSAAPTFRAFTARDGLGEEIWSTIGFDREGFVWAGSASRLARFEGERWRLHSLPEASGLVRDMITTPDGTLWAIFEREGLASFDGQRWVIESLPAFPHRFSSVTLDHERRECWVAVGSGFYRWRDGRWQPEHDFDPPGRAQAIAAARTETLFGQPREWRVRARGEVWYRQADTPTREWTRFEIAGTEAAMFTDLVRFDFEGREQLWILTYGQGVFRIDEDGIRQWRAGPGALPSEAVYSAAGSCSGVGPCAVWLASRAGLIRIMNDRVRVFDRRHGLPDDAVRGLKIQRSRDGHDVLWLATEGGIARAHLVPGSWRTISRIGARENGVLGLVVDEGVDGQVSRVWVGSAKQGIGVLSAAGWQYLTQAGGALPDAGVRNLWRMRLPDGTRPVLATLEDGRMVSIDDTLGIQLVDVPWQPSGDAAVSAVPVAGPDGAEVWFGTLDSGLWRWSADGWSNVEPASERQSSSQATALAAIHGLTPDVRDDEHRLWLSTGSGLWSMVTNRAGARPRAVQTASRLSTDGYRAASVIRRGSRVELWAASWRSGVIRFDITDPDAVRPLVDPPLPEPPDPTVYSVLVDRQHRVYVCTNNGVQQLTPDGQGEYRSRVFRRRYGLVHDECNTQGQYIDRADRYWVGTLAGLSLFDPALERPPSVSVPAPIRLLGARRDGRALDTPSVDALRMPAGTKELFIDFALLSNRREEESRYRTRLLGLETQPGAWSDLSNRTLAGLAPGRYQLEIEALDHAGVAGVPMTIDITADPLWWQRPLVWLLTASMLVALVMLGGMLYTRALRARERVLERAIARRTDELRRANLRLARLSYRDPLTGLANRRRLDEKGERAIRLAVARDHAVGLLIIDVDHFKPFNDRYGHAAGDSALIAVAGALRHCAGGGNLVARLGGEEFACLVPDATGDALCALADRIRETVAALRLDETGPDRAGVTVSIGAVVVSPGPETGLTELLRRADVAMYRAKRAGRNRYEMASADG